MCGKAKTMSDTNEFLNFWRDAANDLEQERDRLKCELEERRKALAEERLDWCTLSASLGLYNDDPEAGRPLVKIGLDKLLGHGVPKHIIDAIRPFSMQET
jgi:hypothetical protein